MKREEVLEKVRIIFKKVFNNDMLTVNNDTPVKNWDSFERIDVIVAIEEEFEIRFPMRKIMASKNVGEIIDAILEAVTSRGADKTD